MAQLRDENCCICFDPRIEGVVDCRRCVAFVCQTCVAKLSATASCPVCKNPRFVPARPRPPPTIDSVADGLVRAVIEANLYRRYGSQAFGASVNISINWPTINRPLPPPLPAVDVIQQTVDRMNATGPFAPRDPRAAEDVTPQPQPQRQHQFQRGEYMLKTRDNSNWVPVNDPSRPNITIINGGRGKYRITKVNRSSIHFEDISRFDDAIHSLHKRVIYDDFNRKYYVPMGQRYRLYDS